MTDDPTAPRAEHRCGAALVGKAKREVHRCSRRARYLRGDLWVCGTHRRASRVLHYAGLAMFATALADSPAGLRHRLGDAERELAEARQEIEAMGETFHAYHADCDELRRERDEARAALARAEREIAALVAALTKADEAVSEVHDVIAEMPVEGDLQSNKTQTRLHAGIWRIHDIIRPALDAAKPAAP